MKKTIAFLTLALAFSACVNDDKYDWDTNFADKTGTDTINVAIVYNGTSASVTRDDNGFITVDGANVVVKSNTNKFLQLTLSGSTDNGSLIIYSWKKLGVVLNGVSITNYNGPAINNQCGKSFFVTSVDGTTNTLSDSTATYPIRTNAAGDTIDQKGTLFSEGQIYFRGSGTLNIIGKQKNGIASDDYIIFESGTVKVDVRTTGSNGIKVKDGFTMKDGTLTIDVAALGARGINNGSYTTFNGGTTTITTTGDCEIDTVAMDTTSCACIKSDSLFTMTAGSLTLNSSGDGGKGINCNQNIEISGGTFVAATTGSNTISKPKAVKSDTGIILSGGYFLATTNKSWACDNGTDSDNPEDRVTINGTPSQQTLLKKKVLVQF